jgi:hypothetical protein
MSLTLSLKHGILGHHLSTVALPYLVDLSMEAALSYGFLCYCVIQFAARNPAK